MEAPQELLASLSRRSFVLGTGAMIASLCVSPYLGAADAVDRHEKLWRQLIVTVLPVERTDLVFDIDKVMLKLKLILASFPEETGDILQFILPIFDHAAVVIHWNGRPFHSLQRSAAIRYCQSWEQGYMWQVKIMKALKSMIFTAYWSLPETWPAIGYQGPVSDRLQIPSLGVAPQPQPKGVR